MLLEELYEAISAGKVDSAMNKIISYIEKNLDVELIKIPGVEHFKNSKGEGYGIRYIYKGSTKCLRFNWGSSGSAGKSAGLVSIDVWNGNNRNPDFNITTKDVSLVKVLPSVVQQIQNPYKSNQPVFAASMTATLTEAKKDDYDADSALRDFLKSLQKGSTFTRSEFGGRYHISNIGLFDTAINNFSNEFEVQGKRLSWKDGADAADIYDKIMDRSDGMLEVSSGGSNETYEATAEEQRIEESDHVSFSDSIDHLEGLVKGIAKGSFNALFVAGAGGCVRLTTPINIRVNNKDSYDYLNQS